MNLQQKIMRKQNIFKFFLTLIGLFLVSYVSNFFFFRIDLTAEKRYTLTAAAKNILKNLRSEVYIKIYLDGDDMPVGFKRLRKSLKELLDECKIYSNTHIDFEFINPTSISDKKKRFQLYDYLFRKGIVAVESQEIGEEGKTSQKMVFPGIILIHKGKELGISVLKTDPKYRKDADENINNSIQSLEYELINGIHKISLEKRPQIAFIEGHNECSSYEVADVTNALTEYYDVKRGKINGEVDILNPFSAIIVAAPQTPFQEKDKFVIDQYIMNGGKVLFLVDGAKIDMDSLIEVTSTIALPNSVNLEDLLFKLGARVNPDLIADFQCSPIGLTAMKNEKPQIELFRWIYFPLILSQSSHPVVKYLGLLKTEFISSVDTVGDSPLVKRTVLLTSSQESKADYVPLRIGTDLIHASLDKKLFCSPKPVAVLLEGNFESLYKNRKNLSNNPNYIKKDLSETTKIIVVGDGDMIRNEVSPKSEIFPLGFDKYSQRTFAGNKEFILNAMNYLCDNSGLMTIRCREIKMRLLNKTKMSNEKLTFQLINILIPMFLVIFFGVIMFFVRKMKY